MKKIGLTLFAILILLTSNVFAHKDRIERPIRIQFIFADKDSVVLSDKEFSLIKLYSEDIVAGERKLLAAYLTFNTGETAVFEYKDFHLSSITLRSRNKEVTVPQETIDKIGEVHFNSVALLWDGNYKKAFRARYFYLQFDIGKSKFFNRFTYVQLFFEEQSFSKALVWTPVSENSKSRTDL